MVSGQETKMCSIRTKTPSVKVPGTKGKKMCCAVEYTRTDLPETAFRILFKSLLMFWAEFLRML